MHCPTIAATGRESVPLCCSYLLLLVGILRIGVEDDAGCVSDRTLRWAFGVLANGQYEVLGAWPESLSREMQWQEVFDDLAARGVEQVRFISSSESGALRASLGAAYTGGSFLLGGRPLETLTGLPRRHRGFVRAGADAMPMLQLRATRAIARHGPFFNMADATAFTMNALARAEHCLSVGGDGGATPKRLLAVSTRSNVSKTGAFGR